MVQFSIVANTLPFVRVEPRAIALTAQRPVACNGTASQFTMYFGLLVVAEKVCSKIFLLAREMLE